MPVPQDRTTHQARRRSVRVTGKKLARSAPLSVRARFGLDPRDGARIRVALMAESDISIRESLAAAALFVDSVEALEDLPEHSDQLSTLRQRILQRGEYHSVRTLRVHRLRSTEHNGFPLRRTQLVVLNREKGNVTTRFSEVAGILEIMGIGTDEGSALSDLESQFEQLVREKVRIPPHERRERDEPIRAIVNHLVDWDLFASENPLPRPLWGQVVNKPLAGRMTIRWLLGPGGVRRETGLLPVQYAHARLTALPGGRWFRAVVKEYPDRIEWIESPHPVPDPEDPAERKKAWDAIPVGIADDPDIWPLKEQ